MSPFILWLFFTLDKVLVAFNVFFVITLIFLIVMFLIWLIGGGVVSDRHSNSNEVFWEWTHGVAKHMKVWLILATVICLSSALGSVLVPNTKEAVAIVIIPKVIDYAKNNKNMMKIPDNILNMANKFMEKKIADWSLSISKDSAEAKDTAKIPVTSTKNVASIDSQIARAGAVIQELEKAKELISK
jgi:hypothetical protein